MFEASSPPPPYRVLLSGYSERSGKEGENLSFLAKEREIQAAPRPDPEPSILPPSPRNIVRGQGILFPFSNTSPPPGDLKRCSSFSKEAENLQGIYSFPARGRGGGEGERLASLPDLQVCTAQISGLRSIIQPRLPGDRLLNCCLRDGTLLSAPPFFSLPLFFFFAGSALSRPTAPPPPATPLARSPVCLTGL